MFYSDSRIQNAQMIVEREINSDRLLSKRQSKFGPNVIITPISGEVMWKIRATFHRLLVSRSPEASAATGYGNSDGS